MKLYTLERTQRIPIPLEEAWRFFSSPDNLSIITPPWLDFRVTNRPPDPVHEGAIVTYTVRPYLGLPVRWVTEITHVRPPYYFVDEQRVGPYRFWHHQHEFQPVPGGTQMRDIVHYALPFGPVGRLVHRFSVARQLEAIFDFRREILQTRFAEAVADPGGS